MKMLILLVLGTLTLWAMLMPEAEAKRRPVQTAVVVPDCAVVNTSTTLPPASSETYTVEGCPAFSLWAAYAEIDKAAVPFDTADLLRYDVGLTVTSPSGEVFARDTHDGWKEAFAYNNSAPGTWVVTVDNHGTNQFNVNVLAGGQP